MAQNSMSSLSYGLHRPEDILKKLVHEGQKVEEDPHPFDVFNFVITAAVLNEWIVRSNPTAPEIIGILEAKKTCNHLLLPNSTDSWISDKGCIPNQHIDTRVHVLNVMRLCWDICNASKHFHWVRSSEVQAIQGSPIVTDWYNYFFASIEPDLYVQFAGHVYGLKQIRDMLIQFYTGLLRDLAGGSPSCGR